jgi:membrane protease YdiL (CAAX protease family)
MNNSGLPNSSFGPTGDLPNSSEHASASSASLGENIFLDDGDSVPVVARTPLNLSARNVTSPALPGPGLPEALLWIIGCFAAHVVGSVAMLLLLVISAITSAGRIPSQVAIEELLKSNILMVTGGEQLVFVLFAMAAVFFRFGRNRASQLGLRLPRFGHVLLVVALTFPVAFVSGHCFHVATEGWQVAVATVNDSLAGAHWWIPFREFLRSLDENRTMDVLKEMSGAPLPLLLIIIAVAPALGEELMFRGLIGRGLVARWGVVRGVLLTSLLFGIVHIHPAHALGVIPLGIAMHFVYLTTRSFWAPVLLHFLNNAWATTATKYSAELEGSELLADNVGLPPQVLVQSLVVTVAISMLLWHTRVRYVLPTGEHWSPSYTTAEMPPPQVLAEPLVSPPTRLLLLHGMGSLFALGVILWQSA